MTSNENKRWYCRNLGDALLADPLMQELCDAFEAWQAESPQTAASGLFMRHESAGQLHCDVKLYFSPAAAEIAHTLHATPSRKPGKEGMSLLVGGMDAWSALDAEV